MSVDPRLYRFPNMVFTLLKPGKSMPVNTATFRVPLEASKPVIANYLEQIYGVKVKKVNTMIYQGKEKRSPFTGQTIKKKDWKKAVVRIAPGAGADWSFPTQERMDELMKQAPGTADTSSQ